MYNLILEEEKEVMGRGEMRSREERGGDRGREVTKRKEKGREKKKEGEREWE